MRRFCSFASRTCSSLRTTITIDTDGVTEPRRTGRERQSMRRRSQHTYPTYAYATERAAPQNKNFTFHSVLIAEATFFRRNVRAECLPSPGPMNQAFYL